MSGKLLLSLCGLLTLLPCAPALDLVRNGKPVAQIVLGADVDATVALAAEELNLYLQRMSQATLPIVPVPTGPAPTVHLGTPNAAWAASAQLPSLTYDGFVVKNTKDRLVLAGNVPVGTLNAVYWLLEELGVRWFIPTELGENVPGLPTVSLPPMRERIEPRFPCRKNHGINRSIRGPGGVWQRRIRITDHRLHVPFNRYSHNLLNIVRVREYGETHPEYFPLIKGKRHIPVQGHSWQPCTTNHEVTNLAIKTARHWWKRHPYANVFSVGMNDGRGWCECDKCTALDIPGHLFRRRPVKSERYFEFVREVAEGVRESHPDRYVSCIAYSSVEPVPQDISLPENVFVVITQDVGAWHDPRYKAEDQSLARSWAQKAGAFGVYNYTSEMWLLPRVYPRMMADALRFYEGIGAVAITNESWPTWWYAGPMMYLRAKLMWDPHQDADTVLDEYYKGFFGPAQRPMKRLYERFETCMTKEREGRWFYGIGSVPEQIALWSPEDLEFSLSDLATAREAATAQPYADRVDFVSRGFASTEAILREYWQAEQVRATAEAEGVDYAALVEAIKALARSTSHRKSVMEKVMQDELLSGIYERLINERGGRLTSWRGDLAAALAAGLNRLLAHADELPATLLADLVSEADEAVARQIRGVLWIRDNPDAPNLCPNPGFGEAGSAAPDGIDWKTDGTPPGWSTWSIDGDSSRLTWEKTGGRSNDRCAAITGARLSTFIASIPVHPGQRYVASVWVKSTGSDTQTPRLAIKWQKTEGGWTCPEANVDISGTGGLGRWQHLASVVEVPEGAGRFLIMPRALNQEEGDVALFDDARLVRLPDDL